MEEKLLDNVENKRAEVEVK